MIHSTYLNSAVSLRCRNILSSSLDDPTYFLEARFETNPLLISSSFNCCCCCCCANNSSIYNALPRINPRFVCNALRQSTLIQFSPCKTVIIHGRRRQSCYNTSGFSSLTDSDRNYYYGKLSSFKEKRKQGGLRKGRGYEDKRKERLLSNVINDDYVDDVDIMLSLLTEEVGLDYISVRDRKRINKNDNHVKPKTKNIHSSVVKRDLKCDNDVVNKKGTFVKGTNRDRKKDGSSCSSYYSVSSTGEFDSENEVEVKHEYKDDREEDSYRKHYDQEIEENVEEFSKERNEILKKNTSEGYYRNQDWRKKSEKMLNEESSQHQSHISVNFEGNDRQNSEKDDRISDEFESRMKYKRFLETSEMDNRIIGSTSSSQKKLNASVQEDEYRRQSNVISEASSSSSFEARMMNQEEILTEVSGRVEDFKEEKHKKTNDSTTIRTSGVKSQEVLGISDARLTNSENTFVSRRQSGNKTETQFEARMRSREDILMEDSGRVEDFKEETHQKTNDSTTIQTSRVKSQQILGISDTRISNTENTSVSHRQSGIRTERQLEARMKNREDNEMELSGWVEDFRQETHQKKNYSTTIQTSGVKSQQISRISDTHITNSENTSVSQRQSEIKTEKRYNITNEGDPQTESTKTSRRTTKASSFNIGMPSEPSKPYKALKLNPEPSFQETGAHGAGSSGSLPVVVASSSSAEHVGLTHEHSSEYFETVTNGDSEEPLSLIAHKDALNSADQEQKSTSQIVGEFLNKAKHELSVSEAENKNKTTNEAEFVHEEGSGQDGSGSSLQKDGTSGPSDEMWHVTGASNHEPPETGAPDTISLTRTGESVKKSGRTLWNIIGDVVRLRWVSPRSEAHTPNQSTSSEAWFSGHEQEESINGSRKDRSQSQKEPSNPSSSNSPLLSSSLLQESSFPLPAIRMRRSPVINRTSGTGEMVKTEQPVVKPLTETSPADATGRGKMVIVDKPVLARVTETDSKNSELKQRKLGRIDQVSKDRFDEWEEAYTVESKQRQNDEFFMREALLEARKAADFWEVPVGAVLVHDGKIIARGYNLVEELRDSTAHAEMICIREASNNLRSWRLSGTTLYVTLEPCPMCAGAILQARIDTVVWGAPNKLLGADGSWIRLFPDGDGGNGSDKAGAPVHPFHPNMTVRRGVLSSECADVMQQFFQLRRKKKEKKTEAEAAPLSSIPISHHHRSKLFTKMHDVFNIMFCL